MSEPNNPFQKKFTRDIFTGEETPEAPALPPVLLFLALPLIAVTSVVLIPVFPVAATLAALLGYATETLLGLIYDWAPDELSRWVVMGLVMMVGLFCALPLEGWVVRRLPRYRPVRHWIRVAGLTLMITEIGPGLAWDLVGSYDQPPSWALSAGISADKLVIFALIALGVHVVFRLIDTRGRGRPFLGRMGLPGR